MNLKISTLVEAVQSWTKLIGAGCKGNITLTNHPALRSVWLCYGIKAFEHSSQRLKPLRSEFERCSRRCV